MAGSAAFGIMNIYIIVSERDRILEFCAVFKVVSGKHVFSYYHAAFSYADLVCGHEKFCFFKTGNIILHKQKQFEHLFAHLYFGFGEIQRIGRVQLYHARGIEVYTAVNKGSEHKHVFARIFNFALSLEFIVQRVYILNLRRKSFDSLPVNAAHTETQRHGLAESVVASESERAGRKICKACITCRVNKDLCRKLKLSRTSAKHGGGYFITVFFYLGKIRVKQQLHAIFDCKSVKDYFHIFFIIIPKQIRICFYTLALLHELTCFGTYFCENSFAEPCELTVDNRAVLHKRHNKRQIHCASERSALFDKYRFCALS